MARRKKDYDTQLEDTWHRHWLVILLLCLFGAIAVSAFVISIVSLVRVNQTMSTLSDVAASNVFSIPSHAVKLSDTHYQFSKPNSTLFADIKIHRHGSETKHQDTNGHVDSATVSDLNKQCYGPLFPGVRWRRVEGFIIDPTNSAGLSTNFITTTFAKIISVWETYTVQKVWGTMTLGVLDISNFLDLTGYNGIAFGAINIGGVTDALAVTISWHDCPRSAGGSCTGPDQFIEWKQIYDTVNFPWGDASLNSNVIDLWGTGQHEFGHVLGLIDVYASICRFVTMYGYSSYGETQKRTPEAEDIQGVHDLGYAGSPSVAKSNEHKIDVPAIVIATLAILLIIL